MGKAEVLDTWLDFIRYWRLARSKAVDEQILLWQEVYMGSYPELLRRQIESYGRDALDWREVAKKIFPAIPSRFRLMRRARENILSVCGNVYLRAAENLKVDFDVIFVIYVGVGCGAGWADFYEGKPTVLLAWKTLLKKGGIQKGSLRV